MIDLATLKHFLFIARHQNLASASEQLHLTPGALSKSLRRLEEELQVRLFDRDGRALKLNLDGERLKERAAALLSAAEQLQSEFAGEKQAFKCRIAAPALLHLRWGQEIAERVIADYPKARVSFEQKTEHAALASVLSGECDVAVVTTAAIEALDARLTSVPMGQTEFKVAISAQHPLAGSGHGGQVSVQEVLRHDFAALLTPPFMSLERHAATDGWRDDIFPRTIRYRSDDLLLISQLLAGGKALAYLPDYVIRSLGMQILTITGCPYFCRQTAVLAYRKSASRGWINSLATLY
ncbi:LysR family transcriptional regulator [Undibacterium sp.]|uniref:LysR family transcriptional regulator n=1 Tax=Undibacterium sp. TaxID=1914977 RepID=UPI002BE71BD1|nr:LysR family transcriptional regulator [Undibacterium sp.]HTD06965.1 LysR family transcriptional regulator [Undibacterium sp.]